MTLVEEAAPGCQRGRGVARPPRAALLRLQQVGVAAAGAVEVMAARADEGAVGSRERGAAAAHRAEQGDHRKRGRAGVGGAQPERVTYPVRM